jgi:hypothetical protein
MMMMKKPNDSGRSDFMYLFDKEIFQSSRNFAICHAHLSRPSPSKASSTGKKQPPRAGDGRTASLSAANLVASPRRRLTVSRGHDGLDQ